MVSTSGLRRLAKPTYSFALQGSQLDERVRGCYFLAICFMGRPQQIGALTCCPACISTSFCVPQPAHSYVTFCVAMFSFPSIHAELQLNERPHRLIGAFPR